MHRLFNKRSISTWLLASLITIFATKAHSESEPDVWSAFRQGEVVALMRHAIAPGNGDPVVFTLGDCATQRNLSQEGVSQAKKIGLKIKEHGVKRLDVYSSQWCRCVDTATHLNLGPVRSMPALNSFYQNRSSEQEQTSQLSDWIVKRLSVKKTEAKDSSDSANVNAEHQNTMPAILVTHQVNITALTGVFPRSGEVVFVSIENDQPSVLATWIEKH